MAEPSSLRSAGGLLVLLGWQALGGVGGITEHAALANVVHGKDEADAVLGDVHSSRAQDELCQLAPVKLHRGGCLQVVQARRSLQDLCVERDSVAGCADAAQQQRQCPSVAAAPRGHRALQNAGVAAAVVFIANGHSFQRVGCQRLEGGRGRENDMPPGTSGGIDIATVLHAVAGVVHFLFVLIVTFFWPSATLIGLLAFQVVAIGFITEARLYGLPLAYLGAKKNTDPKSALNHNLLTLLLGHQYELPGPGVWDVLSFQHARHGKHNWLNYVHFLVLGANLVAFLTVTHNQSPPTTIQLTERQNDHTLFGAGGGFHSQVFQGESLPVVQLAQKGFYYAEVGVLCVFGNPKSSPPPSSPSC